MVTNSRDEKVELLKKLWTSHRIEADCYGKVEWM